MRESDFYFKRSFDPEYISQLGENHKIFPLGLNYQIASDKRDFFKLERAKFYRGKDQLKTIIKSLKIADSLGFDGETEQLDNLSALPRFQPWSRRFCLWRGPGIRISWNQKNKKRRSKRLMK